MESINFPYVKEHTQLHADIIESLAKIIHTPAKLSIIKSKMRVVAKRILIEHIMHDDIKIKEFLPKEEDEQIFDLSDL
jgi:hemerythrin